jgi:hypothetical protein
VLWIKEGDAPTNFFHVHANSHRRKKFIHTLEHHGHVLVAEESKAQAFFDFFDDVLGTPPMRACNVDFQDLDLPTCNLSNLDEHFTKVGIRDAIRSLLTDKAPWSDGFT